MPFGVANDPALFQELMNKILSILRRRPEVQRKGEILDSVVSYDLLWNIPKNAYISTTQWLAKPIKQGLEIGLIKLCDFWEGCTPAKIYLKQFV